MPSITRRRLIGGGAALAAGAYGAYRLDRGASDATFASWTPDPGTWPLQRYDPANTAHNPTASPPGERPSRSEIASVATGDSPYFRPLVGSDFLALFGSEFAAFPVGGGETVRADGSDTPLAGFGPDGRLHTVRQQSGAVETEAVVVGYAADDLSESYRHTLSDTHPNGMAVGTSELYLGTSGREVVSIHPGSGHDWQVGGTMPALADGRLYATAALDHGLVAYGERSGLDRRITPGPTRIWGVDGHTGETHPPAVADGRVTYGTFGVTYGGTVSAYDAESGEQLWEPRSFGGDASTPAVVGDRGYVAAGTDSLEAGLVACLDLASGETIWRDEVGWYAYDPVVGGETLVVAGEVRAGPEEGAGKVRAYDVSSGDALWTVTVEGVGVDSLAVVDERVLVTAGGSVYELTA